MTAFQPEQRFGFMTSGQEEAVEKADSDIMKTKEDDDLAFLLSPNILRGRTRT